MLKRSNTIARERCEPIARERGKKATRNNRQEARNQKQVGNCSSSQENIEHETLNVKQNKGRGDINYFQLFVLIYPKKQEYNH